MTDARNNATDEVTAFGAAAEWTGVRDAREPGGAADPAWLAMRRELVTASDVAAILGEDDRRCALDVYVEKITDRQGVEAPLALDDRRVWGSVLEQPILAFVARYHGWTYRRGGALLRSRAHPFLGATLDAEIDQGAGPRILEGKTTAIPRGWDEESGDLPTRVLVQVQTQLLVTGADGALVFALIQGCRPCLVQVAPSPEFHAVIIEECGAFAAAVRALEPPAPQGGSRRSAKAALARLYPSDDGRVVALPREAVEWTREYQEVSERLRELGARKDHLADMLRAHIGPATWGVLPEPVGGKACWRWQTQPVEGYTVEPRADRVLRAMKSAPVATSHAELPPALRDTLVEALSASVEATADAAPIRMTGARRRGR